MCNMLIKIIGYIGMGIFGVSLLLAVIGLLGVMIDTTAKRNTSHDRCLKHATNGYEIWECH